MTNSAVISEIKGTLLKYWEADHFYPAILIQLISELPIIKKKPYTLTDSFTFICIVQAVAFTVAHEAMIFVDYTLKTTRTF